MNTHVGNNCNMRYKPALIIYIFMALLFAAPAHSQELQSPRASVREDVISVSTHLKLSKEMIEEIRKGVAKEVIFYVDLFRDWEKWPDEFVKGVKIHQQFKCDPVKNENKLISTVGTHATIKRFSTCDELIQWSLELRAVEITGVDLLEEGEYYVKVTVESRLRELPPVVNLLLFFVKETEFKVSEETPSFLLRR